MPCCIVRMIKIYIYTGVSNTPSSLAQWCTYTKAAAFFPDESLYNNGWVSSPGITPSGYTKLYKTNGSSGGTLLILFLRCCCCCFFPRHGRLSPPAGKKGVVAKSSPCTIISSQGVCPRRRDLTSQPYKADYHSRYGKRCAMLRRAKETLCYDAIC